jgi:hypothetical protein
MYQTILEPINGEEARKILKSMSNQAIDKIPMLRVGNAYKRIELGFELIFKAFPADCPVPSAEWQLLLSLKDDEDVEFSKDVEKLEIMREHRDKIVNNLQRIDAFLAKHSPEFTQTVIDSDEEVPDEMRIRHKLKVPMVHTAASGTKTEVLVNPQDIK